jgi:beta-aspartyl-peptidase (threonine type)
LTQTRKPVIAVHGGAGTFSPDHGRPMLEHVSKAAEEGFNLLKKGANAVTAVTEAVASLEDSGAFNAGAGSALNLDGRVEMEASVMDGKTLAAGAAGLLIDVKNPVRVARLVMEKTDHVFRRGKRRQRLSTGIHIGKTRHDHNSETCPIRGTAEEPAGGQVRVAETRRPHQRAPRRFST